MSPLLSQTYTLTGLTCSSCVAKVTARLLHHHEVEEAVVTLQPPQAHLKTHVPLSEDALNAWLQPLGKYRMQASVGETPAPLPEKNAQTYRPLLLLLAYLGLVVAAESFRLGRFEPALVMRLLMGGFFVAFSFFKMLDLQGFSAAYRSYDLVARAVPAYGLVYPFIELGLGLAYLADLSPSWVNATTAVIMSVSLVGVLRAVLTKRAIRCACLGTVFNLPMSTVTIVEDGSMLVMALLALAS